MRTDGLPPGRRRLCLAVDIEKYSSHTTVDHIPMMRQLAGIVQGAVERAGAIWAECDVQDQGDGLLVILPAGFEEGRGLAALVTSLRDRTDETNLAAPSTRQVRLRVAVTQGIIHKGDTGYAGPAVIAVARLLDSEPARDTLRHNRSSDVGVIIADDLFQDVVAQGYPGLNPALFRGVAVEIAAKGFTAQAWTYAAPPPPAFRAEQPATPAAKPLARWSEPAARFARDVAVGVTGSALTGAVKHLYDAGHHHHHADDYQQGHHHADDYQHGHHDTHDYQQAHHDAHDYQASGHHDAHDYQAAGPADTHDYHATGSADTHDPGDVTGHHEALSPDDGAPGGHHHPGH